MVNEKKTEQAFSLIKFLKLPQDVIDGDSTVRIIGRSRIRIENFRNLAIYTDTQIKLSTNKYNVEIYGKKLKICYYDKDEMEIYGKIEIIKYEE